MSDNIIKNGSFEQGESRLEESIECYYPDYWHMPIMSFPRKENSLAEMCDSNPDNKTSLWVSFPNVGENIGFDSFTSYTLYQVIDLTNYNMNSELFLNIEFYYSLSYREYEGGELDVMLYKLDSFDEATGKFTHSISHKAFYISRKNFVIPDKDYETTTQGASTVINYDPHMVWRKGEFSVSNLSPGYYLLMFGSYKGNRNQITFDNVSGTVIETLPSIVDYHNVIKNGSFESYVEDGFYYWICDSVDVEPYYTETNSIACKAYSNSSDEGAGLKQIFEVPSYCRMEILLKFYKNNRSLGLSIYEVESYVNDSNYTIKSTPYYQTYIDTSSSSNDSSNWGTFIKILSAEPKKYLLVIRPNLSIIDDVAVNLYTSQKTDHDGSYEKPYTIQDGRFYAYGSNFVSFTGDSLYGFIYYEGNYYHNEWYNGLASDEIRDDRYYYPDGRMAVSESFIYQDKLYTADAFGYITYETDAVLDLVPYYDDEFKLGPIRNLDIIVETYQHFNVFFATQTSEIAVNVSSSDSNIVICTGVLTGKEKNQIELLGKYPGKATITISYTNANGYTVSKDINITVLYNSSEYIDIASIYFVRDKYGVLLGNSTQLEYGIAPTGKTDLAIDWISSDPSIASVDANGFVTGHKKGSCQMWMYNYRLGMSHSCIVNVITEGAIPRKIKLSQTQTTIKVGQSKNPPHYELCDYNGDSYHIVQDGYWKSDDPSIAVVDKFGMIVGKSEGRAIVRCKTPQNTNISAGFIVNVVATDVPIADLELDIYEAKLSYKGSYYLKIGYRALPEGTNQNNVTWSSSNPDLVWVLSDGRVQVRKDIDFGDEQTVIITCASKENPSIIRTCTVTVVSSTSLTYPFGVKSYTKNIRTVINKTVDIKYEVSNAFMISYFDSCRYEVSVSMVNGSSASSSSYTISHIPNESISFLASEVGDYKITLKCYYDKDGTIAGQAVHPYGEEYFYVYAREEAEELTFSENLEVLYALNDGSYILRCFVRDNSDNLLTFSLNTGSGWNNIIVDNLLYKGKTYNYIFGSGLAAGNYSAQLKVTNNAGDSITSNSVILTIPNNATDRRDSLAYAKLYYDRAENDIVDYLYSVIQDEKVYSDEKSEFDTRYKVYCPNYYNLKYMLEFCIEYINSKISTAQAEMASLAETLNSSGVNTASYSEGDQTTSNYQNVSDLDYYQNECIKQLVNRVLQLEAKLNELTNNNN